MCPDWEMPLGVVAGGAFSPDLVFLFFPFFSFVWPVSKV